MTISHISTAVPSGDPTSSFTITVPTVLVDDLLLLVVAQKGSTSDPSVVDNDSGGNSWTKLNSSSPTSFNGSVWWKRATGSTSAKTITVTGAGGSTSMAGTLSVFRGVIKTGNPYNSSSIEQNASGDEAHGSLATLEHGSMVCFAGMMGNDHSISAVVMSDPSSVAQSVEKLSLGGSDTGACLWYGQQATMGATGEVTWTMTDTNCVSLVFALTPYPGAVAGSFFAVL